MNINDYSFSPGIEDKFKNLTNQKNDVELKKACDDFESYFIQLMFKEMRKTVNEDQGIIKKSQGEKIFRDLLDEQTSKLLTANGGIGLSNMMYMQMKLNNETF